MHQKLKLTKRFAGLSIIEVVIASSLLIVAMIPILKSLAISNADAIKIEHKSRSLLLAQAKLEEIKAKSIYNYTNGGSSFAENNTSLDGSYLCNVTDDADDSLKTIAVSVGFDLDDNSSLSSDEVDTTLVTLIARRWTD